MTVQHHVMGTPDGMALRHNEALCTEARAPDARTVFHCRSIQLSSFVDNDWICLDCGETSAPSVGGHA